MSIQITSEAFKSNKEIPKQYTCDGKDVSPPLKWSDLPADTKSLALIVDDPDAPDPAAPMMTWVHWVLYNIPPAATGLPIGVGSQDLPEGTKEGLNDWKRTGYGGPCPPSGTHRYFFRLFALDTVLDLPSSATAKQLTGAMKGHIVDQTQLMGLYSRR